MSASVIKNTCTYDWFMHNLLILWKLRGFSVLEVNKYELIFMLHFKYKKNRGFG